MPATVSDSKWNHLRGPTASFDVDEGARTFTKKTITSLSGATENSWSWAEQLEKNELVKIKTDWTVEKSDQGDNVHLGFAQERPRFMDFDAEQLRSSEANPPAEELRTVTIEMMGAFVRSVIVGNGDTNPVVGDSIQAGAVVNEWTQDLTRNHSYVLFVGADDVEDTLVLFGYDGDF